jgi:hypothetical protein
MRVPKLLAGTLAGAAIGGILINPCNGGAAVGAIVGLFIGLAEDLSTVLLSRWRESGRRDWITFGWLSRGPVVPDRVVHWIVALILLSFVILSSLS